MTAVPLDRLTHSCHIFEMNGESYRFRESLKSKKGYGRFSRRSRPPRWACIVCRSPSVTAHSRNAVSTLVPGNCIALLRCTWAAI
jgi:hypothetical protein